MLEACLLSCSSNNSTCIQPAKSINVKFSSFESLLNVVCRIAKFDIHLQQVKTLLWMEFCFQDSLQAQDFLVLMRAPLDIEHWTNEAMELGQFMNVH